MLLPQLSGWCEAAPFNNPPALDDMHSGPCSTYPVKPVTLPPKQPPFWLAYGGSVHSGVFPLINNDHQHPDPVYPGKVSPWGKQACTCALVILSLAPQIRPFFFVLYCKGFRNVERATTIALSKWPTLFIMS